MSILTSGVVIWPRVPQPELVLFSSRSRTQYVIAADPGDRAATRWGRFLRTLPCPAVSISFTSYVWYDLRYRTKSTCMSAFIDDNSRSAIVNQRAKFGKVSQREACGVRPPKFVDFCHHRVCNLSSLGDGFSLIYAKSSIIFAINGYLYIPHQKLNRLGYLHKHGKEKSSKTKERPTKLSTCGKLSQYGLPTLERTSGKASPPGGCQCSHLGRSTIVERIHDSSGDGANDDNPSFPVVSRERDGWSSSRPFPSLDMGCLSF